MGILAFIGRAAKGTAKLMLDQTTLTEKGRKKQREKEKDELRRLRLEAARQRKWEINSVGDDGY